MGRQSRLCSSSPQQCQHLPACLTGRRGEGRSGSTYTQPISTACLPALEPGWEGKSVTSHHASQPAFHARPPPSCPTPVPTCHCPSSSTPMPHMCCVRKPRQCQRQGKRGNKTKCPGITTQRQREGRVLWRGEMPASSRWHND